jgi:flagellar biosynthesis repressor protein FlbT
MGLVVELKPGERVILGGFVVTVRSEHRTQLHIQGDGPILREGDAIIPDEADTPAKRLYVAAQLMYLSGDLSTAQAEFFQIAREMIEAAPSMKPYIARAGEHILAGRMFKALRELKALIRYQDNLLARARPNEAAPSGPPAPVAA